MTVRGPPFNFQGGAGVFVTDKLFIPTRLGGALKISNFTTCLYRTVIKVFFLFHAGLARNYLFQKIPTLPLTVQIFDWFQSVKF